MSGGNRFPDIPKRAARACAGVSKADLAEALYDLAALQNPTSCDSEEETFVSLVHALGEKAGKRALAYVARCERTEAQHRMVMRSDDAPR